MVVEEYGILPRHGEELIAIDGRTRTATFRGTGADGATRIVARKFDMIHVTPPPGAPDIVRHSPLADEAGWLAVDPASLRHTRYDRVFGLGDAIGAGSAKTASAVRMQVPVVARNLLALLDRQGVLCSIKTTADFAPSLDVWPGSRAIAIAKAGTANDFSNNGLALSTANLYGTLAARRLALRVETIPTRSNRRIWISRNARSATCPAVSSPSAAVSHSTAMAKWSAHWA